MRSFKQGQQCASGHMLLHKLCPIFIGRWEGYLASSLIYHSLIFEMWNVGKRFGALGISSVTIDASGSVLIIWYGLSYLGMNFAAWWWFCDFLYDDGES